MGHVLEVCPILITPYAEPTNTNLVKLNIWEADAILVASRWRILESSQGMRWRCMIYYPRRQVLIIFLLVQRPVVTLVIQILARRSVFQVF
ncbi:MAG: hypothetical protein CL988_01405 [Euryarchaeota archaeon]|nr:hypothetical protein [Euryarchaeota archaeon]